MRVFITGTEGYIGARLAPHLLGCGHEVVGLDSGFYRDGCLYLDPLGSTMMVRCTWRVQHGRRRPSVRLRLVMQCLRPWLR